MIKLVTDSSALYTKKEGEKIGIKVCPLGVTVDDKPYRDLEEIDLDKMLAFIKDGFIPKTSQPIIGDILDIYENVNPNDEILHLAIADGLSGAYNTAVASKEMVGRNNIHIINTKTLCGPHKYLVELATKLIAEGKDIKSIKETILKKIETTTSYLIPQDFDFLKRGGRLTPLAANLASAIKLTPVITMNEECKLVKHSINRTMNQAFNNIINQLKKDGVNENFKIFISHDKSRIKEVEKVINLIKQMFPYTEIETLILSPAFIVQGGPGCIAVQTIEK